MCLMTLTHVYQVDFRSTVFICTSSLLLLAIASLSHPPLIYPIHTLKMALNACV